MRSFHVTTIERSTTQIGGDEVELCVDFNATPEQYIRHIILFNTTESQIAIQEYDRHSFVIGYKT